MNAIALTLILLSIAQNANREPGPGSIGARIGDFALRDYRGNTHRLADWRDRKLIVVVFLGVDCPLAKLYAPRLTDLAANYAGRGVAVVGIHANEHETAADIARFAGAHQIAFPLLQDVHCNVADRIGARRTPEAFILDQDRVIRYRGRIDDQYEVGLQRPAENCRYLRDALEELLAGKHVSRPRTEAVGCLIARAPPSARGSVTYTRDVAPILYQHCQRCHRPGQIAPFSLTSYGKAAAWSSTIREVVEQGRMPPWSANPKHGRFANDPTLSAAQKQTLLAWIDAGCPEGAARDLPPAPQFADGWHLADPDVVLSMLSPFTVPAQGVIEYQTFVVDPGFTEDRWVQAAEIRPGNRAVVHHCNVFLQPPGAQGPTEAGALGSYALAMMAGGTPPMVLPDGMAKRIPAGWRLVFVMHYAPIGSVQTDQTSIALKFAAPGTVRKEVATKLMVDPDLCIPPHAAHHEVSQTWEVTRDVVLLSMFPHMHLRGKSFRYEAVFPDGTEEILLDVPRYDFAWQHNYILAEPRRLPAGTKLRATAVYDNSAGNPANPDPSATVRAGPQSWDEMFNGYFDIVLADQDLTEPESWPTRAWTAVGPIFRPLIVILCVFAGGAFLIQRRIAAPPTQS